MNGYYQYEDPLPLARMKQQNFASDPHRSRPSLREESPAQVPAGATVWNVVSSLVQALSSARDELLTLLTSDSVRVAGRSDPIARQSRSPTRSPSRSPCRSPHRPSSAPSDSKNWSRSPTRASGDCGRVKSSNSSDHSRKSRTASTSPSCYTPPVSFGMNLQFDSVRRGRSPPAGCRRPAGRYQPMSLGQRGITAHGLEYFPAVPPGYRGRRPCTATRFADLIKAETAQLRDRRLAEESASPLRSRPSWY